MTPDLCETLLLVVAPDPCCTLVSFLEGGGFEVARARSSREAVQIARSLRPAAVLKPMDLGGDEIEHELRSNPRLAKVPLVMVEQGSSARQPPRVWKVVAHGLELFSLTTWDPETLMVALSPECP